MTAIEKGIIKMQNLDFNTTDTYWFLINKTLKLAKCKGYWEQDFPLLQPDNTELWNKFLKAPLNQQQGEVHNVKFLNSHQNYC